MTHDPETLLAGFALALRSAGVPVTADRTAAFVTAAAVAGVANRDRVYWAGRATLIGDHDHMVPYDRVFDAWFSGEWPQRRRSAAQAVAPRSSLGEDSASGGTAAEEDDLLRVHAAATGADVLRTRDIASLTPAERALLGELFARLRPRAPLRRARRRQRARTGDVDPRRTLREELRQGGEPAHLRYRAPARHPRRVVLLLDVSGSMSSYADELLRLAHVWVRRLPSTEVFTMGTRLTRVTRPLRSLDPEAALRGAGEQVPDWSGGTRLGEVLRAFLDRWGQRGVARGAVVVVCSDGWERGDTAQLGEQMARLRRLAHAVVWMNPHRGKPGYAPVQAGIVAAWPYIDALVAGHSMAAFVDLEDVVAQT